MYVHILICLSYLYLWANRDQLGNSCLQSFMSLQGDVGWGCPFKVALPCGQQLVLAIVWESSWDCLPGCPHVTSSEVCASLSVEACSTK